jgi:hypothetical protein
MSSQHVSASVAVSSSVIGLLKETHNRSIFASSQVFLQPNALDLNAWQKVSIARWQEMHRPASYTGTRTGSLLRLLRAPMFQIAHGPG